MNLPKPHVYSYLAYSLGSVHANMEERTQRVRNALEKGYRVVYSGPYLYGAVILEGVDLDPRVDPQPWMLNPDCQMIKELNQFVPGRVEKEMNLRGAGGFRFRGIVPYGDSHIHIIMTRGEREA